MRLGDVRKFRDSVKMLHCSNDRGDIVEPSSAYSALGISLDVALETTTPMPSRWAVKHSHCSALSA